MCRLDDRIVNRVGTKTKHKFHGGENGNWLTLLVLQFRYTQHSHSLTHVPPGHGRCNEGALTHTHTLLGETEET